MSLIYTSGTTGLAKGVLREAMTIRAVPAGGGDDAGGDGAATGHEELVTAPMYHAAPNAQAVFALALGIETDDHAAFRRRGVPER